VNIKLLLRRMFFNCFFVPGITFWSSGDGSSLRVGSGRELVIVSTLKNQKKIIIHNYLKYSTNILTSFRQKRFKFYFVIPTGIITTHKY